MKAEPYCRRPGQIKRETHAGGALSGVAKALPMGGARHEPSSKRAIRTFG
jgi:hypothetical protein